MKEKVRYVFGVALAGMAFGGVHGFVDRAQGAAITQADFTFETSGVAFSTSVTQGSAAFGPVLAEVGTGSAYGSHVGTNAVYSSPAGNGSLHSLSSNVWLAGDYYQFTVPTTGIQNIVVSYDQISSSTGPKVFNFLYSTDGTTFSTAGSYSIGLTETATNSTGGTATESSWGTASTGGYNHSFDLSGIPGLNNDAGAVFEIVDADTTTATGGTDRIDNVIVSGTAVPEPASLSLMTLAAAGLLFRRRKS